jgi:hypothetical protein
MSQQAPVFPEVLLQGLRFRDTRAIKNLRSNSMSGFSHPFSGTFVPIRASLLETRNAAFRLFA